WISQRLLLDQDQLEIAPLDAIQLGPEPEGKAIPARRLLLALEEVSLIDAVDDAILRDFKPGPAEQRSEHVGDVHDLVALLPGRHMARIHHDGRRPERALHAGEVRSFEIAR